MEEVRDAYLHMQFQDAGTTYQENNGDIEQEGNNGVDNEDADADAVYLLQGNVGELEE